ncbi:MAG: DUF4111 domain-containing protein [Butyrivibrio sp.]|nr:DUF4111 domain-containing protein [Butyrivibrio sp.]
MVSITKHFVENSRNILGSNMVGVYLHGSAVMGCFNPESSDIDLLVVVNESMPDAVKRRYMDMVVALNSYAPKKGIEFSIVRKEVCRPFIYPTPFELHFSNTHLRWYRKDPFGYIAEMKGTDKDLAAHFTILYHRGECLYGEAVKDVFEKVPSEFYFDSILCDIENAEEEIAENPTYIILNLCRVLAYEEGGLILSKQEGGEWGLDNVPEEYHTLISQALDEYQFNRSVEPDRDCARRYAAYMMDRIRKHSMAGES